MELIFSYSHNTWIVYKIQYFTMELRETRVKTTSVPGSNVCVHGLAETRGYVCCNDVRQYHKDKY